VIGIERRTVPGETPGDAVAEMDAAVQRVRAAVPTFNAECRHVFSQWPSDVPQDAPIVRGLRSAMDACAEPVTIDGLSAWTDAALLNAAGIPAICYGPGDISLAHSATEWVVEDEIPRAAKVLERLARSWCGGAS
jgi:acetylornithine deacetylase